METDSVQLLVQVLEEKALELRVCESLGPSQIVGRRDMEVPEARLVKLPDDFAGHNVTYAFEKSQISRCGHDICNSTYTMLPVIKCCGHIWCESRHFVVCRMNVSHQILFQLWRKRESK